MLNAARLHKPKDQWVVDVKYWPGLIQGWRANISFSKHREWWEGDKFCCGSEIKHVAELRLSDPSTADAKVAEWAQEFKAWCDYLGQYAGQRVLPVD